MSHVSELAYLHSRDITFAVLCAFFRRFPGVLAG